MKNNTRRILLIGGTLVLGLVFCTWLLSLSRTKEIDAVQKKPKSKVKLIKYGDLAKYYPMSKMGSFDQTTNKKRYWENAENGTAVHPEINGLSYSKSDRA